MTMQPISRSQSNKPIMTVDQAVAADRKYFDEHPDEDAYIREFVPGEFDEVELPEIPEGFVYATHVQLIKCIQGQPVGRYRQLMAIIDRVGGVRKISNDP